MKIKDCSSYILITPKETSYKSFLNVFESQYNTINNSHLLLDLTSLEPLTTQDVNSLLKWTNQSRKLKKSFIIIIKNIAIDEVSENLVCTPTLLEAQDTFEMEEMERDLGF